MIDLAYARQLLLKAMETRGRDFIYCTHGQQCYYEPTTSRHSDQDDNRRKTGCMIGVALYWGGETRQYGSRKSLTSLAREFPDMLSIDAKHYFHIAQKHQDTGYTWGHAYDAAEAAIKDGTIAQLTKFDLDMQKFGE